MKHTTVITLAMLVAVSVISCSGKKAPDAGPGSTDDQSAPPGQNGDANWSATIDGSPVTGSGVDQLQQQNSAYILPVQGPGKKHLLFLLYSTKNGADQSFNTSLRVWIPPAAGTYVQKGSNEHSCDCGVTLNENVAAGGDLARYESDSITVTVTSMTTTRVIGTFSGTFKIGADTPRAPRKTATVVNGKFDLPMATSKITPE